MILDPYFFKYLFLLIPDVDHQNCPDIFRSVCEMFSLRRVEMEDGSILLTKAKEQSDNQFNPPKFVLWHIELLGSLIPQLNSDPMKV